MDIDTGLNTTDEHHSKNDKKRHQVRTYLPEGDSLEIVDHCLCVKKDDDTVKGYGRHSNEPHYSNSLEISVDAKVELDNEQGEEKEEHGEYTVSLLVVLSEKEGQCYQNTL